MVKFGASGSGGRALVGLGLSEENLRNLRERKPILVQGEEVNQPGVDIMIMWGETEEAIKNELAPYLGGGTRIEDKRPLDL